MNIAWSRDVDDVFGTHKPNGSRVHYDRRDRSRGCGQSNLDASASSPVRTKNEGHSCIERHPAQVAKVVCPGPGLPRLPEWRVVAPLSSFLGQFLRSPDSDALPRSFFSPSGVSALRIVLRGHEELLGEGRMALSYPPEPPQVDRHLRNCPRRCRTGPTSGNVAAAPTGQPPPQTE
jgi:hypothetical protein